METNMRDQVTRSLVEGYRLILGLEPWDVWRKKSMTHVHRGGLLWEGRRSGRTTHGLLTAIARAVVEDKSVVWIDSDTTSMRVNLGDRCKALIVNLGIIGLRVTWEYPRQPFVTYVDHWDAEQRDALVKSMFEFAGMPVYQASSAGWNPVTTETTKTEDMARHVAAANAKPRGLVAWMPDPVATPTPLDPLDEMIDGVPLRGLLQTDNDRAMERSKAPLVRTPAQRAAISAHWSAQLRAKVAASTADAKRRDREQVMMPLDAEDCEW